MSLSKERGSDSQTLTKGLPIHHNPSQSKSSPPPPAPDIHALWRPLPPGACLSPCLHIPTNEEIIAAITYMWCIHWNSFSTIDPGRLCARILAYHQSWHLLEKHVANVRGRALADGCLHRPAFETGLRMQPSMEEVRLREHAYDFDPCWWSTKPAQAGKLRSSFEITSGTSSIHASPPCHLPLSASLVCAQPALSSWQLSDVQEQAGELIWGQLAAFISGMKSSVRDKEKNRNSRM